MKTIMKALAILVLSAGLAAAQDMTGFSSKHAPAVSPEQLLFFDHNSPLGTPTANPKPHTTVLASPDGADDVVSVQYRWQVAGDSACCPTGVGTVQYAIGAGGKLVTRGAVPNQ